MPLFDLIQKHLDLLASFSPEEIEKLFVVEFAEYLIDNKINLRNIL